MCMTIEPTLNGKQIIMLSRVFFRIAVLGLMFFADNLSASSVTWIGRQSSLWQDAENWQPEMPLSSDNDFDVRTGNNLLIVGDNDNVTAASLSSSGDWSMKGGSLTLDNFWGGVRGNQDDPDGRSTFTMTGGLITLPKHKGLFEIGSQAKSPMIMRMSGGMVNQKDISGAMLIGRDPGSFGELHMSGGAVVYTSWIAMGRRPFGGPTSNAHARLDLCDNAQVRVPKLDFEDTAKQWVRFGLITAYGGRGEVGIDAGSMNPGHVTIYALTPRLKASNPRPADTRVNIELDAVVSWKSGMDATGRDIYFGKSNPPALAKRNWRQTTYDLGTLEVNTTYYWRIDEHIGGKTHTGNVWSFTTVPHAAVEPFPVDNAIDVPIDSALAWKPGGKADLHDVYIGMDQNAVNNVDAYDTSGFYRGSSNASSCNDLSAKLKYGKTYYWRVDEIDNATGNIHKGNVWKFKTVWGKYADPKKRRLLFRWSFSGDAKESIISADALLKGNAVIKNNVLDLSANRKASGGNGKSDGSYAYLPVAQTVRSLDDITIEAWIWYDGSGAGESDDQAIWDFCDRGDSDDHVIKSLSGCSGKSGKFGLAGVSDYRITCDGIKPGDWVHIVYTSQYNNDTQKLYVNSKLAGSVDDTYISPSYLKSLTNCFLGRGHGKMKLFDGKIDELRIYSYPLSHSEISANYDRGPDDSSCASRFSVQALAATDTGSNNENVIKPLVLDSGISEEQVEDHSYLYYVTQCVDNLIEYGTDRYGTVQNPYLVTILDVRDRTCPKDPPSQQDNPNIQWRGFPRKCMWKPRGSDLLTDQHTIEVMHTLSNITGIDKYAEFAEKYVTAATTKLVDDDNSFWWGWHRFYDVFNDTRTGSDFNYHEIHVFRPRWDLLWEGNPATTQDEIEFIWKYHITDKATGEHNRHGNLHSTQILPFAMSGGEFIYAFAFMYSKTNDLVWLDRAKLIANYHWESRDTETNLIPNNQLRPSKFEGANSDTSVPGLLSYFMLKTYELTGEEIFRDQAMAYLRAYARYGYDKDSGKFWGCLSMNVKDKPVLGPRLSPYKIKRGGDGDFQDVFYEPRGHLELWLPTLLGYEYPLPAAQIYPYAYQLTGDKEMLETAKRWAEWIDHDLPSEGCSYWETYRCRYAKHFSIYGTYAEMYGRTISFFVHMYAVTQERRYLDSARKVARQAVSGLYYKGLFRSHAAKPYYASLEGVGMLLYSLLQLDRAMTFEGDLPRQGIPVAKGSSVYIPYDNW